MFKAMISAYETASKTPSIEVLIRLSRLFGVSVDYLVCVDAPKMIDVSGMDDETVALLIALLKKSVLLLHIVVNNQSPSST